jgi:type VI secretion system secreted protein Hcp
MGDMFLKLYDIDGESLDDRHHREIEIAGWSWNLNQPASTKLGHQDSASKVDVASIKIEKYFDMASVTLVKYATLGQPIRHAMLSCRKNAGVNPDDTAHKIHYLILTFENLMIKSITWAGKGTETIIPETLELSFSEFELKYAIQDSSGGVVVAHNIYRFDIQTQKAK